MRHEDIQSVFRNHYFTSYRDMGGVRRLVGNIDVIVFFVNDSRSTWTESAKQKYRAVQKEAMQHILRSARSLGVNLQIRNAYVDAALSMNCTRENWDVWSKAIISKYGAADIPTYQRRHKAVKGCTEAPILFVFNKPFRSSSVQVDWERRMYGELSIISFECTARTIVHELLHQFGAMDLYYPDEVHNLIQRMGYESIMAISHSMHIDSLTSYLIGWTEEISDGAAKILERTRHLTREKMEAAIQRQYQKN